jgi:rhamnogalacturonan endolyase
MTGLEFDDIDILGPVKGRLGMGYFDCFCVPSVSSAPPTPENPNPASSRHCTSPSILASSGTKGEWLMVDYVGQSTTANYTLLDGDGWVGLIMSETVRTSFVGDAGRWG